MARSSTLQALLLPLSLLVLSAAAAPAFAQGAPLVDASLTEESFACENPKDRCAWRNATLVVGEDAFTFLLGVSVACVATWETETGGCVGNPPVEPNGFELATTSAAHDVSTGAASPWPQSAHADAAVAGTHVVSVTLVDQDARVTLLP